MTIGFTMRRRVVEQPTLRGMPSTFIETTCDECGALVQDTAQHARWHGANDRAADDDGAGLEPPC